RNSASLVVRDNSLSIAVFSVSRMSVSSSHVGRSTVFFTAGALFSAGCVTEGQPVLCAGVVDCPTVAFCITAEVVGAGNRVTAYAASLIAVVRRVLATMLRCCVAVAVVLLSVFQ